MSKLAALKKLTTVASVSNNLSWIFFAAYQSAIQYQFGKQRVTKLATLAVTERKGQPLRTIYDQTTNTIVLKGLKSWLVSANVNEIIIFARLPKPVMTNQKSEGKYFKSILAFISPDKSTKLTVFEKVHFLEKLKQGKIQLNSTRVKMENILSGKEIRNFRIIEKYFTILSLTIFFFLKIKSNRLKNIYYNLGHELIDLLIKRRLSSKTLRPLNNKFQHAFKLFGKLPERRSVVDWETDKNLFKVLTK